MPTKIKPRQRELSDGERLRLRTRLLIGMLLLHFAMLLFELRMRRAATAIANVGMRVGDGPSALIR